MGCIKRLRPDSVGDPTPWSRCGDLGPRIWVRLQPGIVARRSGSATSDAASILNEHWWIVTVIDGFVLVGQHGGQTSEWTV